MRRYEVTFTLERADVAGRPDEATARLAGQGAGVGPGVLTWVREAPSEKHAVTAIRAILSTSAMHDTVQVVRVVDLGPAERARRA